MKTYVLGFTVLALSSLGVAQSLRTAADSHPRPAAAASQKIVAQASPRSPQSSTDCLFNFSSGSGNTSLSYCVAANGNIVQLETPSGHPQISTDRGEGYGLCDENTNAFYYDYAGNGDSGNWGPATVVSHNSKSVKIVRTTSDGLWTLTQTITDLGGTAPTAKVAMAIKNNSGTTKVALLMRYADVDADGQQLNNLDATINSAYGSNSTSDQNNVSNAYGLVLQNVGNSRFPYEGFVQNGPQGPAPCNFRAFFAASPELSFDGSVVMIYEPEVGPNASATVTVGYKGL
jgi:hypothetical protein